MVKKQYEEQAAPAPEYGEMSDKDLMTRVAEYRDAEAFSVLFDKYLPRLKREAQSRLQQQDADARDTAQQTMLNAWRYASSWDPERAKNVMRWLRAIQRNTAIRALKKTGRIHLFDTRPQFEGIHPLDLKDIEDGYLDDFSARSNLAETLEDPSPSHLDVMAEDELLRLRDEIFWAALEGLGAEDSLIIFNYNFLNVSLSEYAETFGIREDAAKKRLYKARKRLAKEIANLQGVAHTVDTAAEELFLN